MYKNNLSDFFNVYTEFQCLIIAQLNAMDYNGISAIQYNIVEFVYRGNAVKSVDLAAKFSVTQSAISRQIKLLLEKELIIQKQDPSDRRIFYLNVTEKGKSLVTDSENIRKTMSDKISRILSEEELASFSSLLQKIISDNKTLTKFKIYLTV